MATVLSGAAVAKPFIADLKAATAGYASTGKRAPKLIGILANGSAPSESYASWTRKACEDVGIEFELRRYAEALPGYDPEEDGLGMYEVERGIIEANADDTVDGIMVYYPCFGTQHDQYLQQVVSPSKDVEGLNFLFRFNLYHNQRQVNPKSLTANHFASLASTSRIPYSDGAKREQQRVKSILPCTPLAIVKILEHIKVYREAPFGEQAAGKTITVINRSEVVGRPLAALLSNDGARVFSVDLDGVQEFNRRRKSKDQANGTHPHHNVTKSKHTLEECLALSDVVVSGVPGDKYRVPLEHLRSGVVAINFSDGKNFGDGEGVKQRASIFVPNIGKATIVMLQRNLLRLRSYAALE
ncbi:uncharacterized protein L969DRAFT_87349 [Mixia osmundae IAM 14324]|uniref:Methylenetetrahydrofolate dehydrogenase n=1 Tax=Mixia osmundae (strain CBS 9802 / IAM 14324 / JCM 22182 / KY 12970) TaxID=764103 RepID=G7E3J4_MIXOS|nr:uncharacterized protein L969DRAFT_87349 [Mixia osmundae IAM 14324]KEI39389.1 hypothetical protein L969DRAFT_87349 [Mixia osmundae IAM 14324]GAA97404.1 hypothetical protein E5Q_04082 [Mixia osmundae IAM 14324]